MTPAIELLPTSIVVASILCFCTATCVLLAWRRPIETETDDAVRWDGELMSEISDIKMKCHRELRTIDASEQNLWCYHKRLCTLLKAKDQQEADIIAAMVYTFAMPKTVRDRLESYRSTKIEELCGQLFNGEGE